tara:strand:+ start:311 stop:421 length:111 start_codon:yes stop_codon:yes gene_type:complete
MLKKGAEEFHGGGEDYPKVNIIGRYHSIESLKDWIV